MHTNMIMVLVRTVAILLVESGRWRLSAVAGWAPVAVFSRASTGRRVSEEGDLPSLTKLKAMMEDVDKERDRWIGNVLNLVHWKVAPPICSQQVMSCRPWAR